MKVLNTLILCPLSAAAFSDRESKGICWILRSINHSISKRGGGDSGDGRKNTRTRDVMNKEDMKIIRGRIPSLPMMVPVV
jgi:hypothetical protein